MQHDIEILIEDARWSNANLTELAMRAVGATLADQNIAQAGLSVLGCSDARISVLNGQFRDKEQPTNVLSWPEEDLRPETAGKAPVRPVPDASGKISLGDIAIAFDTCAKEADDQGKPMTDHVCHLIVHGTLHLLGYDHVRDQDATLMEALEVKILGRLGVADPY